ncbi:DUF6527 family protein [Bradyrhizobium niftali]|uniref:DUF6527 family protein n=1 Tax=Bradyrhizobium niftali TaxID=2560055 RepID=UPI00384C06BE
MWTFIRKLLNELASLLSPQHGPIKDGVAIRKQRPLVWFGKLVFAETTPANDQVTDKQFVVVTYKGTQRWALFKCPCTCGEVISLPLQTSHSPHWKVTVSEAGRPTLYPSVWRNKGCMSHFWIEDGRVSWTSDTGMAPWVAKPGLYRPRSQADGVDIKA